MQPVFDSPQFKLKVDSSEKFYANVSNCLAVSHNGEDHFCYVEVDTTLFHIMLTLNVSVDSEVTMFLEDAGRKMLFGIVIDEQYLFDLWYYTFDAIPSDILRGDS